MISPRRDFFWVGIPKILTGATTLVLSLAATRFMDPAQYGVFSLCLSWLLLFDGLVGAALDISVLGYLTRLDGGRQLFTRIEGAGVTLKLLTGLLLSTAVLFWGEFLGRRLFHQSGGRAIFWVLIIAGTGVLLLRSVQVNLQAHFRFRLYGALEIVYNSLRIGLVSLTLLSGYATPSALLACYAVAPLAVVLACFVAMRGDILAEWARPGLDDGRALLRSARDPLVTFGLSSAVSRSDLFFLALLASPSQLGVYGAAATIAIIPEVLASYLAPVLLPRILPMEREGSLFGFFRRFHAVGFLACAIVGLAAVLALQPALHSILPPRYHSAIPLIAILLPGTLATASFFPLTLNFLMLKSPRTFLKVDCVMMIPLFLTYALVIPRFGASGVAWATTAFRIVKTLSVQFAAYRILRRTGISAGMSSERRPQWDKN